MTNWIHDIEIKNFKSIRHAKIEDCRRVNVFIGYPNVGKSNILEALTAIQYCKLTYPGEPKDFFRFEDAGELFFEANMREDAVISYNHDKSIFIKYLGSHKVEFAFTSYHEDALRIINEGEQKVENLIDVRKYYFHSDKQKKDGSITFKYLSSPFGGNLFLILRESHELRHLINQELKPYNLKLLIDKTSNSLKLIRSVDNDSIFQLSYSLLADTLQRLIFYQTAVRSNQNSVLLFEEPEAHMFPPYISKFTSDVIYDKNNNQFFIATHSPFVLNDFMEDLEKEDLAIYAVGYSNGETTINRLTDKQVTDIYQYGVDLFFNLEEFLKDVVS